MATKKYKGQGNYLPSSPKYVLAVIVMALIGVAGIVVIGMIRPDDDLLVISGIVIAILSPTTTGLLSFMKGTENSQQNKQTHDMVNSRLTEFIEAQTQLAEARGEKIGRQKAEDRADEKRMKKSKGITSRK